MSEGDVESRCLGTSVELGGVSSSVTMMASSSLLSILCHACALLFSAGALTVAARADGFDFLGAGERGEVVDDVDRVSDSGQTVAI